MTIESRLQRLEARVGDLRKQVAGLDRAPCVGPEGETLAELVADRDRLLEQRDNLVANLQEARSERDRLREEVERLKVAFESTTPAVRTYSEQAVRNALAIAGVRISEIPKVIKVLSGLPR